MEKKTVKLYAPVVEMIWGALVVVGFCSYIFFV